MKDSDIVSALVNLVSPQCGCDFTTSQLTDRVFLCDPSSPNAVTYQVQLHGTRHANVSQLASIIQGLSQETTSIPVQLSLLTIQRFCIVSSTSLSPCSQNDERSALSVNIRRASVASETLTGVTQSKIGDVCLLASERSERDSIRGG